MLQNIDAVLSGMFTKYFYLFLLFSNWGGSSIVDSLLMYSKTTIYGLDWIPGQGLRNYIQCPTDIWALWT